MRLLGPSLLAIVVLLTGCSDAASSTDTATDTPITTKTGAPPVPQTVAIISETAAGGEVDLHAVRVDDEDSRQDFTAQFERGSLDAKIASAVSSATVPDGYVVMGAVVAIGCDVPTDVRIEQDGDEVVLTPQLANKTMQECFAPVTSVAVVAVPVSGS